MDNSFLGLGGLDGTVVAKVELAEQNQCVSNKLLPHSSSS